MEDLVHRQCAGLAEALAALLALERLLFGVDVSVVPEMVLPAERLVADITVEGPLVGVGALVDEQVVGLGELAVAVLADEALLWPGRPSRSSQQPRVVRGRGVAGRHTGGSGGSGGAEPVAHEEGQTRRSSVGREAHAREHVSGSGHVGVRGALLLLLGESGRGDRGRSTRGQTGKVELCLFLLVGRAPRRRGQLSAVVRHLGERGAGAAVTHHLAEMCRVGVRHVLGRGQEGSGIVDLEHAGCGRVEEGGGSGGDGGVRCG